MKALVYKDTVLIFRQMRLFLLVILVLLLLVQVLFFGAGGSSRIPGYR